MGFTSNWLIKLPWQLRCPQTEQKSQQSLIFSSWAYALVYRGSRLAASSLACFGFSCSNFAKKNKRLLAVYIYSSVFTTCEIFERSKLGQIHFFA